MRLKTMLNSVFYYYFIDLNLHDLLIKGDNDEKYFRHLFLVLHLFFQFFPKIHDGYFIVVIIGRLFCRITLNHN